MLECVGLETLVVGWEVFLYQMSWIMPMSRRSPTRSLSQVRKRRLQIDMAVEGMTSKLVWNCEAV